MEPQLKKQLEQLNDMTYTAPADKFLATLRDFPDKQAAFPDDEPYNGGKNLLHIAATAANPEAIQYLLDEGFDPNAVTTEGKTPLHYLAGRGATYDYFDRYNPEPIYQATHKLLDAGANPQKKDKWDTYPFQLAAKTNNTAFLKALSEKNIRMQRLDNEGNNALHLALTGADSRYKWKNQTLYLRAFVPDPTAETLPFFNRQPGKYEQYLDFITPGIQALTEAGVDPGQANNAGVTPLQIAYQCEAHKARAIMKNLPGAATDTQIAATGGMTLQQAVAMRDAEAIDAILDTALQQIDALEDLEPHPDPRYDWDEMPPYGDGTALHQACLLFYPEIIEHLLRRGANPNAKDSQGRTPLAWLFLHNRRVHPDYYIHNTPGRIIHSMIKAGLDINDTVLDTGFTLLNLACASWFGDVYPGTDEKGDAQPGNRLLLYDNYHVKDTFRILIIRELLKHNPDVDKPNAEGITPLMYACGGNQGLPLASDITLLLLEKGATITARDNYGNTPLIYAAYNQDPAVGYDIAQNLYDYGDPIPDAANTAGRKALDYAVDRQNEPLVKLLVK